jgi:3-hydroxyisobutyrate dehydrogenase
MDFILIRCDATERRMTDKGTVGLVGLGLMGQALTHRLVGAGFGVLGYDIDAGKRTALAGVGARAAGSLAEVAAAGAPILLAVFNTDQVEDVVENALAPALEGSGRIIVSTSTCDPDRLASLGVRVAPRGLRLIEAPVSGSSAQVRDGQGVGLIGGDADAAESIKGVLDAVFPLRFHMGEIGNGGRAKLATNLILGLNRLALAEGLVFAERLGLDPQAFLEVARKAACYSQVMDTKGPKMVRGDFSPQGWVHQSLKDFDLILDQAQAHGLKLPLAALNREVLEACIRNGESELDNSVVIREIRRRGERR